LKHTENLVVGLGIAGLNLCHQLEKAGKSFLVIDRCPSNSASLIAAGIYNPIVLKRKVKSWKVDELFPLLVQTYEELEKQLDSSFLKHNFPILKPISSADELVEWQQAVDENRLAPYVTSREKNRPSGPFHKNVIGSVTINSSGFIRIRKLVLSYRNYLKEKGLLIEDAFEHSALKTEKSSVQYRDISADRVLFSEGRFISENPYFNWLPFRPTKGQMITVRVPAELTPDKIYNQQFLLFPTEEKNIFRLGATYEWHNLDEVPTQKATDELIERAKRALDIEFDVLDAHAAIRPNVADRRPVVGRHPEIETVFLFNGMGSKGVMLAPFFAKQLVEHIYDGKEITSEVNLIRFKKRYANS
jgi:glycine/D-amino acid oxidase-like deaminating enzyme